MKMVILKILIDGIMLVLLLLTMAYHGLDYKLHEWLGLGLLGLFVIHNLLNWNWYKTLFKGRYTAVRILYTALNTLLFIAMTAAIITGIIDSIWVFNFLNLNPGKIVWKIHLSSGLLGFLLTAIHLGLNWGPVATLFRRKGLRNVFRVIARLTAGLVSVYGVYAFIIHKIGLKILMLARHTGLDFTQPLAFFIGDYIAVACLFACIGYCSSKRIRKYN